MSLPHTFIEGTAETAPATTPIRRGGKDVAIDVAGPWTLIWLKFSRNKVALVAGAFILFLYLVGIFAEFLAPSIPDASKPQYTYAPPQSVSFFVTDADGTRFQPHVVGYSQTVDQASGRRIFALDPEKVVPIGFFVRGAAYKMWGLFPADIHLVGPLKKTDTMYLLGTDKLGRDLMTRLIYGTRVSMSIGIIGVCISLTLGVILGSIS
jgi:peptide/nickel transport system permease protein